jgi:hypothetical protein
MNKGEGFTETVGSSLLTPHTLLLKESGKHPTLLGSFQRFT